MEDRIYIEDWLEIKPYKNQVASDSFYLKVCNDIKELLISQYPYVLQQYLNEFDIDELACFITLYLEDVVSGTNIWRIFVEYHQQLYNKRLPFFDTEEDYYDDEVNQQDVKFLLWYFFNISIEDGLISPYNEFFDDMASDIMEILYEAYEYAPENKTLKKYFEIAETETDYYKALDLIDNILFHSYLFTADIVTNFFQDIKQITTTAKSEREVSLFLEAMKDRYLHFEHTRLLSLTGKEWAAELVGKKHPLSSAYLNMSPEIEGLFFYKGQDEKNIFVEYIATGEKFNLTKKSFDDYDKLKKIDTLIYMGIVKWRDEWWFSGVKSIMPYDKKIVESEKKSTYNRGIVNFLDSNKKLEAEKQLAEQLEAFLEFNNGSQIAFMPTKEINNFIKEFIQFYNSKIASEKTQEQVIEKLKKEGYIENDNEPNFSDAPETGLVFFNPNRGLEMAFVISAFPLPENKYYKEEESEDHFLALLMSEELSSELAMFCIDNCKNKLPIFDDPDWKKLLDDMDFLLRFWKKNNYHTEPEISFK